MRPLALVLAAGRSSRMGSPKPLLELEGRSLLAWIARALEQAAVAEMLVVVAPDATAIADEALRLGARIATNPLPERGMLSSVLAGLDVLEELAAPAPGGVLLWPADHPLVLARTVAAILEAARGAPDAAVVPVHAATRGHPAWFPRSLFGELRAAAPDRGAAAALEAPGVRVVEVAVADPGTLLDVDTPERLESAVQLAAMRSRS